jgi:hypothetical protein
MTLKVTDDTTVRSPRLRDGRGRLIVRDLSASPVYQVQNTILNIPEPI